MTEYSMPKPELYEMVHYFGAGLSDVPQGAIVTHIGYSSVNLHVINADRAHFIVLNGCRHKDDPARTADDPAGCWDFRPWEKKIRELFALLEPSKSKKG